jgi:hypothetical protein
MRQLCAAVVLGGWLLGVTTPARALDPVEEALLGVGAAVANTGYLPAKLTVAGLGLATGALAGFLTGGSERAAYAIWVPAASGTFLLRPEHFTGDRPVEFLGSDYRDTPSAYDRENNATRIYDSTYERMSPDERR